MIYFISKTIPYNSQYIEKDQSALAFHIPITFEGKRLQLIST